MKYIYSAFSFFVITIPVFAQTSYKAIVPDCGYNCGFSDFIQLGENVLNFIVIASIPVAVIGFIWAGYLILTSGGSSSKVEEGKEVIKKMVWGLLFILGAWLIVHTINSALLREGVNFIR